MEKKEVFSQFNEKVSEITQHYEEIEEMKFDAKLKNGIRFAFTFDSDKFSRKTGEAGRKKHHPVSVFNAVVDILSACTAITLMILWFAHSAAFPTAERVCITLAFIFFPIFFITSSVYHFLDDELTRAVKAMFIVRMGFLIASSALLCTVFCLYRGFLYTIIYLVLTALSLMLLSFGTRNGFRASSLVLVVSYLSVLFFSRTPGAFAAAITGAFASLLPAFIPASGSRRLLNARTIGIFYLVTLISFFQSLSISW